MGPLDFEWVAQVALLRPGPPTQPFVHAIFFLEPGRNPSTLL
jgi:hypothetical protein